MDAIDFFNREAQAFASQYQQKTDFENRLALWKDQLLQWLPTGSKILDLGAGAGHLSYMAHELGYQVIGLEPAAHMLELCKKSLLDKNKVIPRPENAITPSTDHEAKHPSLRFFKGGFPLALALQENPLLKDIISEQDAIFCSSVLEYLPNTQSHLEELKQYLKAEGLLFLSIPNRQSVFRKLESLMFKITGKPAYLAHSQSSLSQQELLSLAQKGGWKVLNLLKTGEGKLPLFPYIFRDSLIFAVLKAPKN